MCVCVYVLLLCFVITIACNFNCSKGKHECNVVGMYAINDLCCCVYACVFVCAFTTVYVCKQVCVRVYLCLYVYMCAILYVCACI